MKPLPDEPDPFKEPEIPEDPGDIPPIPDEWRFIQ